MAKQGWLQFDCPVCKNKAGKHCYFSNKYSFKIAHNERLLLSDAAKSMKVEVDNQIKTTESSLIGVNND